MMRPGWILLLALAVATPLAADDTPPEGGEKPKPKPTAAELQIPDPGTELKDSSVAAQEVARFKKAMRVAKTDAEKMEALERVARWNHASILKAVSKYAKNSNHELAVVAISVMARQTAAKKKAGAALAKQLKSEKRNHVRCALFIAMGVLGYEDRTVIKKAMSFMRRDNGILHLAATRYLGYVKHKPAFRVLAEHLDEPRPKNPNDPTNPPASYWRERWFNWDRNKAYTRWAISQLVEGEEFTSMSEAKNWAESEAGRKAGIDW